MSSLICLGLLLQTVSSLVAASPPWPTTAWSTVSTSYGPEWFMGVHYFTAYTSITVTTLPVPTPALTSYPTSVTQTVISQITWESRIMYIPIDPLGTQTSFSSTNYTDLQTYVLAQPQPTDLPANTTTNNLPCEQCPSSNTTVTAPLSSDSRCAARGLHTGCEGRQCEQRAEDIWWCYVLRPSEYDTEAEFRMGRVCWGGNNEYLQLNQPCESGDYAVPCVPCQGRNDSWRAVNWD